MEAGQCYRLQVVGYISFHIPFWAWGAVVELVPEGMEKDMYKFIYVQCMRVVFLLSRIGLIG